MEELKNYIKSKNHRVISIVGGGGKTTLLYKLAKVFQEEGKRVLVTTTTHIQMPEHLSTNALMVQSCFEAGEIAVLGEIETNQKKLEGIKKIKAPKMEELQKSIALADITFIEADGAKHMSCKIPADYEPVIYPDTDLVIGMLGMSVCGKTLKEACFRYELAKERFGWEEDTILTPERIAQLLLSEQGTRKGVGKRDYVIVLSQCKNSMHLLIKPMDLLQIQIDNLLTE